MFLNPFFLLGGLAASIPLVIHLMHKRHSHAIQWPSLKFLAASNRRTARRRQVQEILLLALRMGLLVMMAVALSRPILKAGGLAGEGAEVVSVIVLDNSMSTAAKFGGEANSPDSPRNRFARAKAAAEEVLAGLPSGASVALRLADGTESATAHSISRNREAVLAALRAAAVSDARGDVGARIAEALADAAKEGVPSAEVVVLSDMQAASFARAPIAAARPGRTVSLIVVDCGGGPFRSVAVSSVNVRARRFVAGAPLGIDVRVKSYSPVAEERRVILEVDGEGAKAERLVKVEKGGSVGFSFQMALSRPGEYTGRVYISPADELAPDDVRHFRIHLAERIPVYVVERQRSAVAAARSSFFLTLALNPGAPAAASDALQPVSPIVPKVVSPADVVSKTTTELLRETQVCLLADLGPMDGAEAAVWVDFVRRGGSLVVFPSEGGGAAEAAEALDEAAGEVFLPAEFGPVQGDAELKAAVRRIDVERVDFRRDGVVEMFRDAESTLAAVSVWKSYQLAISHASGGRTVLPLEGGGVFLAARTFGRGEIFQFAVPAGAKWSDLPARSLFLPLVHTLVYRASAPRERERTFLTGTSPRLPLPASEAGKPVFMTLPGGRSVQLESKQDEAGALGVDLPPLVRAGVYRVAAGDRRRDDDPAEKGAFKSISLLTNPDPEESDPARVGLTRIRELYADAAASEPILVKSPAELANAIGRVRKGLELWDYLFSLALGIALFECFFSNRLAARSKAKREAVPV